MKSEIEMDHNKYLGRPKGLIFTRDEYEFLHLNLINQKSKCPNILKSIKKKEGAGLNSQEKVFVKKKFKKYKEADDEKGKRTQKSMD